MRPSVGDRSGVIKSSTLHGFCFTAEAQRSPSQRRELCVEHPDFLFFVALILRFSLRLCVRLKCGYEGPTQSRKDAKTPSTHWQSRMPRESREHRRPARRRIVQHKQAGAGASPQ